MLDFFYRQYICTVWWMDVSTNDGYELRSATRSFFLHTYEADYFQRLLKNKDRKLAQTFNSSRRYLDDVRC